MLPARLRGVQGHLPPRSSGSSQRWLFNRGRPRRLPNRCRLRRLPNRCRLRRLPNRCRLRRLPNRCRPRWLPNRCRLRWLFNRGRPRRLLNRCRPRRLLNRCRPRRLLNRCRPRRLLNQGSLGQLLNRGRLGACLHNLRDRHRFRPHGERGQAELGDHPDHLFHLLLRSRCTATLAGLRTFIRRDTGRIDTRHRPSSTRCPRHQAGMHGRTRSPHPRQCVR
jgi:hypothetical protein